MPSNRLPMPAEADWRAAAEVDWRVAAERQARRRDELRRRAQARRADEARDRAAAERRAGEARKRALAERRAGEARERTLAERRAGEAGDRAATGRRAGQARERTGTGRRAGEARERAAAERRAGRARERTTTGRRTGEARERAAAARRSARAGERRAAATARERDAVRRRTVVAPVRRPARRQPTERTQPVAAARSLPGLPKLPGRPRLAGAPTVPARIRRLPLPAPREPRLSTGDGGAPARRRRTATARGVPMPPPTPARADAKPTRAVERAPLPPRDPGTRRTPERPALPPRATTVKRPPLPPRETTASNRPPLPPRETATKRTPERPALPPRETAATGRPPLPPRQPTATKRTPERPALPPRATTTKRSPEGRTPRAGATTARPGRGLRRAATTPPPATRSRTRAARSALAPPGGPVRSARQAPPAPGPAPTRVRDRLASSLLSADLPWLYVDGNRVKALNGEPVVLRGFTLGEPEMPWPASDAPPNGILEAAAASGANAIRVPIDRGRVLGATDGLTPSGYVDLLDTVVGTAADSGMWTVLSLASLDDTGVYGTTVDAQGHTVVERAAPQPDYDSVGMWHLLGERYSDEPAVLFDLYAAPRPAHADDVSGFRGDWDTWILWARLAVAELRRTHPRALCLVSGHSAGTDVSGLPLLGTADAPIPNIVYGVRMTPRRSAPWPAVTALAARHPVLVTEWGTDGTAAVGGLERTAELLRGAGIGWFARDAHPGGTPPAIAGATPYPDRFGDIVRRALALAADSPWAAANPAETTFHDRTGVAHGRR